MARVEKPLKPIKMRLKQGDRVRVIAGKNKGEEGEIIAVDPKKHRVTLRGVNVIKKAKKATQRDQKRIGFDEVEAPIHVSNVQIIDPNTNESSKVGFKFEAGKKVRISKKTQVGLDS